MALFDITRPLGPGSIIFPGDPAPEIITSVSGGYTTTRLIFTTHTGTHIDAPLHALEGGPPLDDVPLDRLIVPARVINAIAPLITYDSIRDSGWTKGEGLLIRTSFSYATSFSPDYPVLSPDAVRVLCETEVPVLGTDCPSPEPPDSDGRVHRALLGAGIPILEMLALGPVPPGLYLLIALPMRLSGADGAPVRAVLFDHLQFTKERP
jgi:arylformamidase